MDMRSKKIFILSTRRANLTTHARTGTIACAISILNETGTGTTAVALARSQLRKHLIAKDEKIVGTNWFTVGAIGPSGRILATSHPPISLTVD